MTDFLWNIATPILLAVAGGAVGWLTPRIQRLLTAQVERVRNQDLQNVLGVVATIASGVVTDLMNRTISALKEARADGKLTADEATAAFRTAVERTWRGLPDRVKGVLADAYGSEAAAKEAAIGPLVEREVAAAKALAPAGARSADLDEAEAQLRIDAARRELRLE